MRDDDVMYHIEGTHWLAERARQLRRVETQIKARLDVLAYNLTLDDCDKEAMILGIHDGVENLKHVEKQRTEIESSLKRVGSKAGMVQWSGSDDVCSRCVNHGRTRYGDPCRFCRVAPTEFEPESF